MSNNLDIKSVVSETIELVKTKWQPMLIALLLYVITCIPAMIPGINVLFMLFVTGPLIAGFAYTLNKIRKGENTKATDIYQGFSRYWKAICVYLLYTLIVMVGMVFLIVPGIILACGLFPAIFLVLDADYSIMDTLHKSWEMTKGKKLELFVNVIVFNLLTFAVGLVFFLVFMLLSFIPFLGLLIGILIGIVLYVAVALAGMGIYVVLYGRLTPEIEEPAPTEA